MKKLLIVVLSGVNALRVAGGWLLVALVVSILSLLASQSFWPSPPRDAGFGLHPEPDVGDAHVTDVKE